MKVRGGFVSNSSSSSFIVIDAAHGYDTAMHGVDENNLWLAPGSGECEFGWAYTQYHDHSSRVNFALLQAMYAENADWFAMIDRVITEHTGAYAVVNTMTLDYTPRHGETWAYIDHQSNVGEGANIEMFESDQTLKDFLFGSGSYIQGDNDNRYDYDD